MFLCKWRARKQISLHRDNKVVLYCIVLYVVDKAQSSNNNNRYPWLLFRAQKQLRNSDYRAVAVIGLVTHAIKQAHNDVHNITMALLERRHKERQWVNAWRPHWDYRWMDEMQTMPVWGEPARWNNINNKAALLWATKWLLESSCSYLDEQVFIQ